MYDVQALRAHFPSLAGDTAYFDGPGGTQTPDVVGEAMRKAITQPLSNRGRLTPAERNADDTVLAARAAVADLVGGVPEGVVFGRSMTQLTFDISRAMAKDWEPGDEIVVTRLDHDANVRPWVIAAESVGVTVRWAEFDAGDRRARPVCGREPAHRGHPPRRAHGGLQPDRHPAGPAGHRGGGPGGGRPAVRRRRAPHCARGHRPGRARRGPLRLFALQVPRPALRRAGGRARAARGARPGQAGAGDQPGAGAVRARHPALRAAGGHDRRRRLPGVARRRRRPSQPVAVGVRRHRGATRTACGSGSRRVSRTCRWSCTRGPSDGRRRCW